MKPFCHFGAFTTAVLAVLVVVISAPEARSINPAVVELAASVWSGTELNLN